MNGELPPLYTAILGFGTVGQGIYDILIRKKEHIRVLLGGRELIIVKVLISDASRPGRTLPDGFDAAALLTDSIDDVFAAIPKSDSNSDTSSIARLDVLFEATVGEEPARGHLARALQEGLCRCVVTANKVMYVRHGAELRALAARKTAEAMAAYKAAIRASFTNGGNKSDARVVIPDPPLPFFIGLEACVAAGVPVIKTLQNMATIQGITKIQGLLNGTSNYMLTKMRAEQVTYQEALASAQALGYAEADPHNDVSGHDAFCKVMIAAEICFGQQPEWAAVQVVGIDTLTPADLAAAAAAGTRYRQVASAELYLSHAPSQPRIVGSVRPVAVGPEHPLFGVDGIESAVAVFTDYLGCVMIRGPGAGMHATASVMVEDYLTSVRPLAST